VIIRSEGPIGRMDCSTQAVKHARTVARCSRPVVRWRR
jgi:hypothetical protein